MELVFFFSFFSFSLFFSLTPDASTWLRWPRGGEQERVCPVQYVRRGEGVEGVGEVRGGRERRGGQIAATEV